MSYPYNVFLSYHPDDGRFVEAIAERLQDQARLTPFYDEWHLVDGQPVREQLEKALDCSASGAFFIGRHGLGPWQSEAIDAMLEEHVGDRRYPLIPLILPKTDPGDPHAFPRFLRSRRWIDFRRGSNDAKAFRRLVAAILGKPPGRPPSIRRVLLDSLDKGDSLQRQVAVDQIGRLKDPSVIAALERRWPAEEDFTVRHFIALTLGEIGGAKAIAALDRLRARETDPFARLGIDLALQPNGKGGDS